MVPWHAARQAAVSVRRGFATLRRSATVPLLAAAMIAGCGGPSKAPDAPPQQLATQSRAETAASAQQVETLRVMTWNVCGESGGVTPTLQFLSPAYCPFRGQPATKMSQVAELAGELHLDAVLLQEVCSAAPGSHLDLLKHDLGPGWDFAWAPTSRDDGRSDCRDGLAGTYSTAIAVHGRISSVVEREPLPIPDGFEKSQILCVSVLGWQSVVCTTQLDNEDQLPAGTYAAEVHSVRQTISRYPWTILGGDFNTEVAAKLAPLYQAAAECAQQPYAPGQIANAPTHSSWDPSAADPGRYDYVKLDYLFARSGFTDCDTRLRLSDQANYASTATPTGVSDHAPLYGSTRGGPRLEWRFTAAQAGVIRDVSDHGANGVLSAGASILTDRGGAVAINGSGAVTSATPRIHTDRSFTVSAWVRAEPGGGTMAALGQLGGFATACALRYNTGAGTWSFAMATADDPSAAEDDAVASVLTPLGTWTFVTGVYDAAAGTLTIYIDGQEAGSARHSDAWPAAGPFIVGRDQANGNPVDQLTGAVGDVTAYDYALDAREVLLAYQSGID